MKKVTSLLLAGLIAAASLTACSSGTETSSAPAESQGSSSQSSEQAAEPAEEITLRLAWWGSQVRHDGTIAVTDLYTEQNPNITFQCEFMGFDDYFQKFNTLVAANDVPDVFQLGNNFRTYQSVIEPLDSYKESGILDLSDTTEAFLLPTTVDGQLLGVSLGTNAYCMIYDPAIFEQAGVAEPTDDWTWDDFEQACYQITEKLGIYGTGDISFWNMACYIMQHGEEYSIYNEDATGLGYDDDSIVTDFFNMKKRLIDTDGVYPTPDILASIKDTQSDLIVSSQAAISWQPSNLYSAICEVAQRPLKMVPYPKLTADGPSGMFVRNSQAFSISNNSSYKDEAAKFVSFFLNDLEANELLNGERGVPIMSKVREHLASQADDVVAATYDYLDVIGEIASHTQPGEPSGQIELEDASKRINEELAFGRISSEEAAAEFRSEAEQIMD